MQAPALNADQQAQLQTTQALIREQIAQAGGCLPFDVFMELALYAPGAGYYVNGTHKFGVDGDFVTAPEISPLFSQCLAAQAGQVLEQLSGGDILEFGAGSGAMAADVLLQLERLDQLPKRYLILELSPGLQARQRETLAQRAPGLLDRVHWLQGLPEPGWRGVVLANEVLDAMPVHRFRQGAAGCEELGVHWQDGHFAARWQADCSATLQARVAELADRLGAFSEGYDSEINLRLDGWLQALAQVMGQGALILIDYGYSEREYYHPERSGGTLICHYRHRAHADPLQLVGLQDITANVDFSAVAAAALDAGLSLAGYTTQAHFLINNGLQALLTEASADTHQQVQRLQQVKQLTLPTTMGERFKVIGLQKDLELPLQGFVMGDMRAYL